MLNSDNLRTVRIFLGLHQKQLAELLGVDGSYIAHIEAGRRLLTDELRDKTLQALNLTPDKVTTIEDAERAYADAKRSFNR